MSERDAGATRPGEAKRRLGEAFDAVVLDLHDAVDADVIGQCHGFVWGGGALVLRLPPAGEAPDAGRARLAAFPYGPRDVGRRFFHRLERVLAPDPAAALEPLAPPPHLVHATEEQAEVVRRLAEVLRGSEPSLATLLSDRGRGKSSAIGLALRGVEGVVAVTAGQRSSAREVFRFATGDPDPPAEGPVRWVDPAELATEDARWDAIVVDEAAQLPVPRLRQIVERHASAPIAFATTARGYEGTGRGFVLRFLEQLRAEARPLTELTLTQPMRWDAGDPLERRVFEALLLDAEPARVGERGDLEHVVLDRDRLAADERELRAFFGLLVHAHYRTTPSDLHRLLDAPNLRLHALSLEGRIVAASLVALEGGLPADTREAMYRGRERIRGHALPDTLISHSGRRDAGAMEMVRSVRIAVHPEARREGIGSALVDHVHATYAPDLFGTLFGATPELLRFRRSQGYELVRIGASRGTRTGEPAAVMIRPVTEPARALVRELRADLARDLPLQLELLGADLALDDALVAALREGLPEPTPMDPEAEREVVGAYCDGPRPFEAAAFALTRFVARHEAALEGLEGEALLRARVLHRQPWAAAARAAGFPSVPAAMRALRRAVRALRDRVEPRARER